MNTFIGIKQLWYGEPIAVNTNLSQAGMAALVASMHEVKNVHQDTWGYEESDPEVTEYINELTGQPYYVDETKQGIPTINFTMGEYDYATKAALQGGTVEMDDGQPVGWSRPTELKVIYKSILALSKTGVYILLTNAQITGKGDVQEKNIGLGVQAKACESGVEGIAAEYWFKQPDSGSPNASGHNFTEVAEPSGSPVAQGWYVKDGDNYVLSGDTTVDENATYYVYH